MYACMYACMSCVWHSTLQYQTEVAWHTYIHTHVYACIICMYLCPYSICWSNQSILVKMSQQMHRSYLANAQTLLQTSYVDQTLYFLHVLLKYVHTRAHTHTHIYTNTYTYARTCTLIQISHHTDRPCLSNAPHSVLGLVLCPGIPPAYFHEVIHTHTVCMYVFLCVYIFNIYMHIITMKCYTDPAFAHYFLFQDWGLCILPWGLKSTAYIQTQIHIETYCISNVCSRKSVACAACLEAHKHSIHTYIHTYRNIPQVQHIDDVCFHEVRACAACLEAHKHWIHTYIHTYT